MAAYCTPEDLGRYGVNAKALEGIPSADGQDPPIQAASAFMDGFLGKQFQLPLLAFGSDIKECCAVIAAWRVLSVRGLKPGDNPEDNILRINYRDMLAWLDRVATCKVTPIVTQTPTPDAGFVSPAAPAVNSSAPRWLNDSQSNLPFSGRRR